jgi:hypothetical protein
MRCDIVLRSCKMAVSAAWFVGCFVDRSTFNSLIYNLLLADLGSACYFRTCKLEAVGGPGVRVPGPSAPAGPSHDRSSH